MPKDYSQISKAIVENLGGVSNITNVTHCMTRLRFVLADDSLVKEKEIKKINGVMGVVKQGGQFQVIIGNNVAYAYKEVLKLGNFGEASEIAQGKKKQKLTPKVIGSNILDALVGTMSPLIPAIIGASMVKLLAMILVMTPILDEASSTYIILNCIGDGAFFFLPIMVAASASKKFNTNMSLAIAIAGVLVHPNFIDLMAAAAEGEHVTFTFISMTSVKYTYTVIPALCMTWLLSYIEPLIDRITPAVTKNFLKPMLIVLIASPIAILIVGPAGIWVGTAISAFVYTVHDKLGWVAVAIMGGLWPLLVMTGMHRVFTPTILQTIAETGKEGMVMPSEIGANLSLGGSSLAVAVKTKNKELRQTAIAAAASAIFAGITEPAMYGVAVRLKRPLIASLITGFVTGGMAGIAGLASISMAAPGVATSVQFIDKDDPMRSIIWIVVIMVVAVVMSFVLTLMLGFEDIPEEHEEEFVSREEAKALPVQNSASAAMEIVSPLSGSAVAISEVNDPTFAEEMMGPGIAVEPGEGVITAPADATIMQFETGHAIGFTFENGVEMLVHIGLDTVELGGEGFKTFFKTGDKVKAGDKILEFDIEKIKSKGYDLITPVIITGKGNYTEVKAAAAGTIQAGDTLITLS